jgi:hypothetical protein
MSDVERSPEYTITMAEGAYTAIEQALTKLREAEMAIHPQIGKWMAANPDGDGDRYEEYARLLKLHIEQQQSLIRSLLSSLMRPARDGNVRLSADGPASLFFSYTSGYCGAMVMHANDNPLKTTWSVHT